MDNNVAGINVVDVIRPVVMANVFFHPLNNVRMADAADLEKNVVEILAAEQIKHVVVEWLAVVLLKYVVTVHVFFHLLNNVRMADAADLEKNVAEILAVDQLRHVVMA